MPRNTAAQKAFGPMVLAAIEHNAVLDRRLVDDDLAQRFLPAPLRALMAATRIRASLSGPRTQILNDRLWIPASFATQSSAKSGLSS